MTEDEARELLRNKVGEAWGAQAEFARNAGIPKTTLGLVLSGKKRMTPEIAAALGLTRHKQITYSFKPVSQ